MRCSSCILVFTLCVRGNPLWELMLCLILNSKPDMTDHFFRLWPPSLKSTALLDITWLLMLSQQRKWKCDILMNCVRVEEKSNHLRFSANAIGKQFVLVSHQCSSTSRRKMLVHYKDKCWKNKPDVPALLCSCWHPVKKKPRLLVSDQVLGHSRCFVTGPPLLHWHKRCFLNS